MYREFQYSGPKDMTKEEAEKLLKQMESVLLSKYAAAQASQVSLLKVQVEMAVLEDQLNSLKADAYIQRGECYKKLGEKEKADSDFKEALDILKNKFS